GNRPKTAAFDQNRFLMQNLRGLDHFAVGGKHDRVGQALADELQIDQPIIDLGETRAGKFDQIDLHSSGREIFLERRNQLFRLGIVKRSVKQVHSDHAEGFLLIGVRFIEHAHVNDDLTWFAARLGLKTNAQPTVRFIVLLEASGGYGVGKNEKSAIAAKLGIKAFHQQIVFVIEHRPETLAADVAIGRSVDRVAKGHLVCRLLLEKKKNNQMQLSDPPPNPTTTSPSSPASTRRTPPH